MLEPYLGRTPYRHHGQRVVDGQRLMQAASDIFLGGTVRASTADRDFYVRQLRDGKGSVDITDGPRGSALRVVCGWTLARAHARSGDRVAIACYLGTYDIFDER